MVLSCNRYPSIIKSNLNCTCVYSCMYQCWCCSCWLSRRKHDMSTSLKVRKDSKLMLITGQTSIWMSLTCVVLCATHNIAYTLYLIGLLSAADISSASTSSFLSLWFNILMLVQNVVTHCSEGWFWGSLLWHCVHTTAHFLDQCRNLLHADSSPYHLVSHYTEEESCKIGWFYLTRISLIILTN